jgi:hypothetical protein
MIENKERHGGPYDRGSSDSYYRRIFDPHHWPLGSYHGERINEEDMTSEEIMEYAEGYDDNDDAGNFKEY